MQLADFQCHQSFGPSQSVCSTPLGCGEFLELVVGTSWGWLGVSGCGSVIEGVEDLVGWLDYIARIDFAVFQDEVRFQINCMIPRFVFQHSFRGFFLKHHSVFSINIGEVDFGFVIDCFIC